MTERPGEGNPGPTPRRVVVIGAGLSGLTTAFTLMRRAPSLDVTVLEAGSRAGGTARTEQVDGFHVDHGPNGFLTNVPDTLELVSELGCDAELVTAADAAGLRFLWHRGELVPLPMSPPAFLRTPLLGIAGKLRVAVEPLIPRGGTADETVHAFVSRRLGPSFADAFVGPMVLGITGGDARRVELSSLFPRMAALEREHGGLFRALWARRRAGRAERRALPPGEEGGERTGAGGPAGPSGQLTTLRGGVGSLGEALGSALGNRLRTRCEVTAVERRGQRWAVRTGEGFIEEADALVLAIPAWRARTLLEGVVVGVGDELTGIPAAGIDVLALGWRRENVPHPLNGFGYLVPRGQGPRMLGCLWTSSIFPHQAPSGHVLLRVMVGGDVDPGIQEMEPLQVQELVLQELKQVLGVSVSPVMLRHIRWPQGIPQYRPGHAARVVRIEEALERVGSIWLTGNSYRGVGVNDCVRDGRRVAEAILALLNGPGSG
ncbi:MAG: protoporphyrinogen oxidase [Deltaproteobacteria bacterium]|nr:MAG: protoporphyrinogen oxidase [Deltaproteobacteria bacterium]